MDSAEFRARQAPLKYRYRYEPQAALVLGRAEATLTLDGGANVPTWAGVARAGLHPATGGDGGGRRWHHVSGHLPPIAAVAWG